MSFEAIIFVIVGATIIFLLGVVVVYYIQLWLKDVDEAVKRLIDGFYDPALYRAMTSMDKEGKWDDGQRSWRSFLYFIGVTRLYRRPAVKERINALHTAKERQFHRRVVIQGVWYDPSGFPEVRLARPNWSAELFSSDGTSLGRMDIFPDDAQNEESLEDILRHNSVASMTLYYPDGTTVRRIEIVAVETQS